MKEQLINNTSWEGPIEDGPCEDTGVTPQNNWAILQDPTGPQFQGRIISHIHRQRWSTDISTCISPVCSSTVVSGDYMYGNSVCVELIIKSQSPRNSSRSSSPSTSVDVAGGSIPKDDLREWISV